MLTKDTDLDYVTGRLGNLTPLTRVSLSAKFSGLSNILRINLILLRSKFIDLPK